MEMIGQDACIFGRPSCSIVLLVHLAQIFFRKSEKLQPHGILTNRQKSGKIDISSDGGVAAAEDLRKGGKKMSFFGFDTRADHQTTPCKTAFSACTFTSSVIAILAGAAFAVSVFLLLALLAELSLLGLLAILALVLPIILIVRLLMLHPFSNKRKLDLHSVGVA